MSKIESRPFGQTQDGSAVTEYVLTNAAGAVVAIIDYGAIITRIVMPDRDGALGDVALGFDEVLPYETISPHFGSTIGRYGNRIAKGTFELDGKTYHLPINNGPNSLHGGKVGYDKRMWQVVVEEDAVLFSLEDPDGFQGYPGNVSATVRFRLSDDNALRIEYEATTDRATPINLTNHSYFNLKDAGASDVLSHVLQIEADQYTPVDETLIPTGEIAPVEGTPIDFRQPKAIGQDVEAMGGYDHNLVLRDPGSFRHIATVEEPTTGRRMEVWTDQPGVQCYSGNFLDGSIVGRGGASYGKRHAFCLETQHFPDSPNHPQFPSTILRPGETYRTATEYRFGNRLK